MTIDEQWDLTHSLRGAAASIILALLLSDEALSATQLEIATSYTDKTIRRALERLSSQRLIYYHEGSGGWSLGPAAVHVFKPALSQVLQKPYRPAHIIRIPSQEEGQPGTIYPQPECANGQDLLGLGRVPTEIEYQAGAQRQAASSGERSFAGQDSQTGENSGSTEQSRNNCGRSHQPRRISDILAGQSRKDSGTSDERRNDSESSPGQSQKNSGEPEKFRHSRARDQAKKNSDPDLSAGITIKPADQTDQITDLASASRKNSDTAGQSRKNSEFSALLQRLDIREPAYSRILESGDMALVLAWYWMGNGQKWLDNPTGWLIRRLDDEKQPPAPYLEIARAWLNLSDQDKAEMRQSTYVYGGLERFWQNHHLGRTAVRLLSPIHKAGGFKILDYEM